jgi:hypothetical protein
VGTPFFSSGGGLAMNWSLVMGLGCAYSATLSDNAWRGVARMINVQMYGKNFMKQTVLMTGFEVHPPNAR